MRINEDFLDSVEDIQDEMLSMVEDVQKKVTQAYEEEQNKRFNKLTVLSQAESKNGNSYWNCKCDCGNFITVKGILLSSNGVKSCGCLKSFGESKIISFLQQHNINFEKQKSDKVRERTLTISSRV